MSVNTNIICHWIQILFVIKYKYYLSLNTNIICHWIRILFVTEYKYYLSLNTNIICYHIIIQFCVHFAFFECSVKLFMLKLIHDKLPSNFWLFFPSYCRPHWLLSFICIENLFLSQFIPSFFIFSFIHFLFFILFFLF